MSAVRLERLMERRGRRMDGRYLRIYLQCKHELGIHGKLPMVLLRDIVTPALTVSFRPRIVMPEDLLERMDDEQVRYAILHELTHYRRRDYLTCMLLRALETVWWFNPVVWGMSRQMTYDMETACDAAVVKTIGKEERKHYAQTLLTLFSQECRPMFTLGMGSIKRTAERRIRGVYMKNKTKVWAAATLLAESMAGKGADVSGVTIAVNYYTKQELIDALGYSEADVTNLDSAKDGVVMAEIVGDAAGMARLDEEGRLYAMKLAALTGQRLSSRGVDIPSGAAVASNTLTAEYTTSKLSAAERKYNIQKFADMIDGTVLQPGETWSANETTGMRTAASGWQDSNAIVDGRFVAAPGGGVGQVATTMYNAAIRAELEIVERRNHSIPSTFVPAGLDATIENQNADIDLKIKNPYDVPVTLTAKVSGDELTCGVYGVALDGYYVDFTSETVEEIPMPDDEYREGDTLPDGTAIAKGETVMYRQGRTGAKVKVTKSWYDSATDELIRSEQFGGIDTYPSRSTVYYVNK